MATANKAATAEESTVVPPSVLVRDDEAALKVGDLIGFVLTVREVVPAVIKRLLNDGRVDLEATVIQDERRRNPDRESMNMFVNMKVKQFRLYQRSRPQDPPVVSKEGQIVDQFTTSSAAEPGGALVPGTWFDLRPWRVTLTGTTYEQKDNHNVVIVPFEQRQLGVFDGAQYKDCFGLLQEELKNWDRVDAMWQLKENL
jgi:hypothetical protein